MKNGNTLTRNLVVAGMMLLMAASIFWNLRPNSNLGNGMDARDPERIVLGQQVYSTRCASCHGDAMQGQPNWQTPNADGTMPAPPHDVSGHTWHHPDAVLFQIVQQGGQSVSPPGYNNAMPAFGGTLSDKEIWAVLSFIKSTWSLDVQRQQEATNR